MLTRSAVVVGLGAAGSAAAYHLARRGVRVVGLDRFGESAPYEEVYEQVGITAQAVADAARRVLGRRGAATDEDAAEGRGGTPESDRGGED